MNVIKILTLHIALTIVFLFIVITTVITTVIYGALIRPFLTIYLWRLFTFKGEDMSWVKASKRIYDIEHTLGLWVSPALWANQKN